MYAGGRRRSSNIQLMQLFHELKQQFPTVPDHVVNAYISSYAHTTPATTISEYLEAAANQEPMGRSPAPPTQQPTLSPPSSATAIERNEMNHSESDINQNLVKTPGVTFSKKHESVSVCTSSAKSKFFVKRPDRLDLPDTTRNLQPSEKCKDVHKLLNSDNVSDKPPRSPLTSKRITRNSPKTPNQRLPDETKRKETASTPTQTTDTLLGGSNSVNLSLNVNCSMDLLQSPTRRKSVLQVTPQQPWLPEPQSPRSYTSVNLTLRPPSSEPQAPIDITSQNASLTYSTSSFDSQKGLQSRLQITVGPGGGGSVSATRTRPRSSYHPDKSTVEEVVPYRAGSLNNLATSGERKLENQVFANPPMGYK